jgi:hypothetical protein
MILRIVPSEAERVAAELGTEKIEQALRSFRIEGALIIENIVDTAIISEARRSAAAPRHCRKRRSRSSATGKIQIGGGCARPHGHSLQAY